MFDCIVYCGHTDKPRIVIWIAKNIDIDNEFAKLINIAGSMKVFTEKIPSIKYLKYY